jgi:membrane protein
MSTEVFLTTGEHPPTRWIKTRQMLDEALHNFLAEDSLMVSASIAYHSLLAIFPLLLLLLEVSGIYIRHFELVGRLAVVLQRYLLVRADFIMQNLVGISRAYGKVGVLSFLLLLWSSSGVFLPLEKALNRAWQVEENRRWWRSRLLALEMALIWGSLLLISTALLGGEVLLRHSLESLLGLSLRPLITFLYNLMTSLISSCVALVMFVVVFERLPNRPMRFRQVFPGALLTALLWEAARSLFIMLLPFFNYRHIYGSIGVVVGLMTWAYISSAVMLFGAQVSRALYGTLKTARSPLTVTGPAVPTTPEASQFRTTGDSSTL